jgi:methylated-DNA-[protein]-cysteine S-methyltransferase
MEYVSWFDTEQGKGAVVGTDQGISHVYLPGSAVVASLETSSMSPSKSTEQTAEMLQRYFKGQPQCFDSIVVDLSTVTAFRARILELIRAIPRGETKSYGEVAVMAGVSRAARAIGGAMAANPVPIIIPCHRVVAADGRLTGFSAPGGLTTKKKLLEAEGVEFKEELLHRNPLTYKQSFLVRKKT